LLSGPFFPALPSTIFGPYFVVGAIFSGIASLIIAMALIRRIYSLQEYFKDIHFSHLGTLLVVFSLLWFYFTFAENHRRIRTVRNTVIASFFVLIGMYLERYTIVVPTLALPRVPSDTVFYTPSWVEVVMTLGFGATFIFLYMLFTKFFPIVSIWEVQEGRQVALKEVRERVQAYTPHPTGAT
jgi:molybdopterin-containing oxidoreductase family membrane subunit